MRKYTITVLVKRLNDIKLSELYTYKKDICGRYRQLIDRICSEMY